MVGEAGRFRGRYTSPSMPGEAWWQHSQDGVGFVNQLDGLADHRGIPIKVPLPELVAQNNHWLRLLSVGSIRGEKITAEHRRQTKKLQTAGRQVNSLDVFRNIAAGDSQAPSR